MFRISAAEFFPDLEIGIGPETPQVRGQLDALVPRGEQKRVWKNYYKGNNPEEVAKVISDLTSGCRISAAY